MDILSTKQHKARKQHRCGLCGNRIEIGDIYTASSIVNDEFYVFKSHPRCEKIAAKLKMYDDCYDEGLTEDSFCESISEAYKDISSEKVDFDKKLEIVCNKYLD
jgi:hypothetical protein